MYANHQNFSSYRKSGSRNMILMSDVRLEVEIWPFCTCTMKNMQYDTYLWANLLNFRVLKEIGVEEHNGDVRFKSGSGNMAISCMRNASSHNYLSSLVIVDLAMGQIPHSTEHIFSLLTSCLFVYLYTWVLCQPLAVPGRLIIGEGILTKMCRKKPKLRQFFLFSDILIYGNVVVQGKKVNLTVDLLVYHTKICTHAYTYIHTILLAIFQMNSASCLVATLIFFSICPEPIPLRRTEVSILLPVGSPQGMCMCTFPDIHE